jgi:hypothetical protein
VLPRPAKPGSSIAHFVRDAFATPAYDGGTMKHITRDLKQSRRPESPVRTLADRHLREIRGGSSVIKPEQMITAMDDWEAPRA